MTWKTILKRNTTQNAIDNFGKQRDVLKELDEIVRQYQGEEMIDADEFEDIFADDTEQVDGVEADRTSTLASAVDDSDSSEDIFKHDAG